MSAAKGEIMLQDEIIMLQDEISPETVEEESKTAKSKVPLSRVSKVPGDVPAAFLMLEEMKVPNTPFATPFGDPRWGY